MEYAVEHGPACEPKLIMPLLDVDMDAEKVVKVILADDVASRQRIAEQLSE